MKNEIDFVVYTTVDPKTLILIDTSDIFEYPDNQIVEIKFPNFSTIYGDYYNVDKPTVLTTKSLSYSPNRIDFPDGLYEIRVSVAPNERVFKCKNYLKLDKTRIRLRELISECIDDLQLKAYLEIDQYIVAAELLAESHPKKSIEMFNFINKKLNKYSCDV